MRCRTVDAGRARCQNPAHRMKGRASDLSGADRSVTGWCAGAAAAGGSRRQPRYVPPSGYPPQPTGTAIPRAGPVGATVRSELSAHPELPGRVSTAGHLRRLRAARPRLRAHGKSSRQRRNLLVLLLLLVLLIGGGVAALCCTTAANRRSRWPRITRPAHCRPRRRVRTSSRTALIRPDCRSRVATGGSTA